MNAFENIITQYLEEKGYWVRQSVKVKISKADKEALGLPTMPRPEIDLVALNVKENELLLIEVKSLLDSYGVWYDAVSGDDKKQFADRYRLFNNNKFRDIVTKKLREEYLEQGLINETTKINYALAAGNIHSSADESKIRDYFSPRGWKLFSPKEIKEKIMELSEKGWEDNLVTITAKLILKK
jgi:hypothetical protein